MADEVKLIDADKLIGYLHERYFWDDDDRDMVFKAIEEQPTIESEPVNGWISVKDRLPEYDKTVLVVNEDGYMHTAVRIKGSIARIDEWQIKFGVYFIDNDVWEEDEQGKITHWQPLPEPPKGE